QGADGSRTPLRHEHSTQAGVDPRRARGGGRPPAQARPSRRGRCHAHPPARNIPDHRIAARRQDRLLRRCRCGTLASARSLASRAAYEAAAQDRQVEITTPEIESSGRKEMTFKPTRRAVVAGIAGSAMMDLSAFAQNLPSSPVTLNFVDVAGNLALT